MITILITIITLLALGSQQARASFEFDCPFGKPGEPPSLK